MGDHGSASQDSPLPECTQGDEVVSSPQLNEIQKQTVTKCLKVLYSPEMMKRKQDTGFPPYVFLEAFTGAGKSPMLVYMMNTILAAAAWHLGEREDEEDTIKKPTVIACIVCPSQTMQQWSREIQKWTDGEYFQVQITHLTNSIITKERKKMAGLGDLHEHLSTPPNSSLEKPTLWAVIMDDNILTNDLNMSFLNNALNVVLESQLHAVCQQYPFDMLVVDECHFMRTPTSNQSINLKLLMTKAQTVAGATATPVFCSTPRELQSYLLTLGHEFPREMDTPIMQETVQRLIKPTMVRMSLADVQFGWTGPLPRPKAPYRIMLEPINMEEIPDHLKTPRDKAVWAIESAIRRKDRTDGNLISGPQVDFVNSVLENAGDRLVIITMTSPEAIKYWHQYLEEQRYVCSYITGDVTPEEREKRFNAFKTSKGLHILIMGTTDVDGISLGEFKSGIIIFLHYLYVPSKMRQQEGRLWRIFCKGDRHVICFYLSIKGNRVDERVVELNHNKVLNTASTYDVDVDDLEEHQSVLDDCTPFKTSLVPFLLVQGRWIDPQDPKGLGYTCARANQVPNVQPEVWPNDKILEESARLNADIAERKRLAEEAKRLAEAAKRLEEEQKRLTTASPAAVVEAHAPLPADNAKATKSNVPAKHKGNATKPATEHRDAPSTSAAVKVLSGQTPEEGKRLRKPSERAAQAAEMPQVPTKKTKHGLKEAVQAKRKQARQGRKEQAKLQKQEADTPAPAPTPAVLPGAPETEGRGQRRKITNSLLNGFDCSGDSILVKKYQARR